MQTQTQTQTSSPYLKGTIMSYASEKAATLSNYNLACATHAIARVLATATFDTIAELKDTYIAYYQACVSRNISAKSFEQIFSDR